LTPLLETTRKMMRGMEAFLALLFGLVVRGLPEALAGRYPLGFDTTTDYLVTLEKGTVASLGPSQLLLSPRFFNIVQQGAFSFLGDAIVTIKVLSVLFFGLFTLSIYLYASRALKLGGRTSLLAAAFASVSWLSLRVSWDLERNMLGLILAIFALVALASEDRKVGLISLPLAFMATWAHPMVAVFLGFGIAVETLYRVRKRGTVHVLGTAVLSVTVVTFLAQNYSPSTGLAVPGWGSAYLLPASGVWSSLTYFLLLAWPLLLLSIGIIWRRPSRSEGIYAWLLLAVLLAFLLPLMGVNTEYPFRVWLMLCFPLSITAAVGAMALPRLWRAPAGWGALGVAVLLILGVPYLVLEPQQVGVSVFLGLENFGPSAYQQNVVPVSQTQSLLDALHTAVQLTSNGSTALLPEQFYGLALYAEGHSPLVVDMGYVGPLYNNSISGAASRLADGRDGAFFVVWWNPGQGWYGEASLSSDFTPVASNGVFTVYRWH
jgi:hypothetical protein